MASAIVLRPNVEQANLTALRDGYQKMQALSGTDNRSWVYWGEFHGFNRYDCWHHSRTGPPPERTYPYDLFLPWHRAYLVNWEHIAREQNPEAIPPWWDWTSALSHEVGLPSAYTTELVDGHPNPLFNGPTPDMPEDPARRTRRFPGDPSELPSATAPTPQLPAIDSLLELPNFVDFSSQLADVHDFIHGWTGGVDPNDPNVGGDMGNIAVAAFDPIFWAHHAMIDRLWYQWQLKHGLANIPPNYLDKVLTPFGYTVRQVLDVRQLGYEYASSSASAAPIAAPPGGASAAGATNPGGS